MNSGPYMHGIIVSSTSKRHQAAKECYWLFVVRHWYPQVMASKFRNNWKAPKLSVMANQILSLWYLRIEVEDIDVFFRETRRLEASVKGS